MSDQRIWRQLSQTRTATVTTTIENAVDQLLERAVGKSQKVSHEQLADTILAIDAMDVASYALRAVIDNFRLRHRLTLQQIGFKEVWVVGPLENLTWRLD